VEDKKDLSLKDARIVAKEYSENLHHCVLSIDNQFEQYENREMTEWSYPNGITK